MGSAEAHYRLSCWHHLGEGVEKNEGQVNKKVLYHAEEAAIGGHTKARCFLGCIEWNSNNKERAVKHWIIAAKQGCDESTEWLMRVFKAGFVDKEVLAAALRAHQAAVDATKSPQREAAERYRRI